jgi:hypothetical protein
MNRAWRPDDGAERARWRAGRRLAAVCGLMLSLTAGASGQSPANAPQRTYWDHNGSIVYLVANGAAREFYYEEPRPALTEAGAHPGALLFTGKRENGRYVGTAFIFNRRCGQSPYQVSGPILDNDQRVVLTGQAPRVGADCRIRGHVADRLEFTLRASGNAAVPPNGYGEGWYVSEFWSGEYPPGFSVTRKDAVVQARASMDTAAPREVACRLPYLAVIHPWNRSRIAKSGIRFVSATRIVPLVAKETFIFEAEGTPAAKLHVKKGDTIEYIRNDAEGAFEVRIAGKQYTAGQNLFDHVEDVAQDRFVEEDWALLTCEGGERAYILLADLRLDDAGERPAGISEVGPGRLDYGKARDLTAAEARALDR